MTSGNPGYFVYKNIQTSELIQIALKVFRIENHVKAVAAGVMAVLKMTGSPAQKRKLIQIND